MMTIKNWRTRLRGSAQQPHKGPRTAGNLREAYSQYTAANRAWLSALRDLAIEMAPHLAAAARLRFSLQLAYFDRRDSREAPADLMLIRPDGSDTRNLTESPKHDDHSPRVSPVRDEIAFVSNRSGVNDVYVVDYATGAVRNLTHTPDAGEWMPQFSPDGERIAFVILPASFRVNRDRLDYGAARIAVVDREGRRLFETNGINPDWMPAWAD